MSEKNDLIIGMQDNLVLFNNLKLQFSILLISAFICAFVAIYIYKKIKSFYASKNNLEFNKLVNLKMVKVFRFIMVVSGILTIITLILSGLKYNAYKEVQTQLDSQKFQLDNIVEKERLAFAARQREMYEYERKAKDAEYFMKMDKEVKEHIADFKKENPEEFAKIKQDMLTYHKQADKQVSDATDQAIKAAKEAKSPSDVAAIAAEAVNQSLNGNSANSVKEHKAP